MEEATLAQTKKLTLSLAARVEVMGLLISGNPFDKILAQFSNEEMIALQKFVWDKTVEIGLRLKGKSFTRKDITQRMVSTPTYQRAQTCSERIYYCKGVLCIHSNATCARNKINGQLAAMQAAVQQWLADSSPPRLG